MSIVSLVSGGLDSTLMAVLIQEEAIQQHPLFVDYGQRGRDRELNACRLNFSKHSLPEPHVVDLSGYGRLISCGLTDASQRVFEDAFLPGRNMMFLLIGAAYAYQVGAGAVAIGLLDEAASIFPDQTKGFADEAASVLSRALGRQLVVLTPLLSFTKADVMRSATARGITDTYSCHAGGEKPCGLCVACREYIGLEDC